MRDRVRFPTGRFVHYAGAGVAGGWGWPTLCLRVMRFHARRARLTDDPVTCPECIRRARP